MTVDITDSSVDDGIDRSTQLVGDSLYLPPVLRRLAAIAEVFSSSIFGPVDILSRLTQMFDRTDCVGRTFSWNRYKRSNLRKGLEVPAVEVRGESVRPFWQTNRRKVLRFLSPRQLYPRQFEIPRKRRNSDKSTSCIRHRSIIQNHARRE